MNIEQSSKLSLNRVINQYDLDMIYVSGPGYGGPAVVANAYLEGIYSEIYPDISQFDMTVLNDLNRFHLVMDAIDRLPQLGAQGAALKQKMQNKLVEHKQYINQYGQDLPEICNWKWPAGTPPIEKTVAGKPPVLT